MNTDAASEIRRLKVYLALLAVVLLGIGYYELRQHQAIKGLFKFSDDDDARITDIERRLSAIEGN